MTGQPDSKEGDSKTSAATYVEIWSKAVDTQMHFNEMCVKSRQLGLTFVAAALGVSVVLLSREGDFSFNLNFCGRSFPVHISALIILAAAGAVYGVRLLDLGVYHRMLRGAVKFGEDFEQNYMKQIFQLEKGMTQAVTYFSRHDDAKCVPRDGKYVYEGGSEVTAERKIKRFYNFVIWALVIIGLVLLIGTATRVITPPTPPPTTLRSG